MKEVYTLSIVGCDSYSHYPLILLKNVLHRVTERVSLCSVLRFDEGVRWVVVQEASCDLNLRKQVEVLRGMRDQVRWE